MIFEHAGGEPGHWMIGKVGGSIGDADPVMRIGFALPGR